MGDLIVGITVLVAVGVPWALSYVRWYFLAFLIPAAVAGYGIAIYVTSSPGSGGGGEYEEEYKAWLIITFSVAVLALIGAIGGVVARSRARKRSEGSGGA
jgi:hypothetical protein